MADNRKDIDAQEKGFNSTAAYGDPKKQGLEEQGESAGSGTQNLRTTDSVADDLAGIDVSEQGLPANDQAAADVPPAGSGMNDVPDADRSLSDSTEHLSQNAADRTRRNDEGK